MTDPGAMRGSADRPRIDVVILTRGNRPHELERAVDSARRQTGVEVSVIVVGNGWRPTGLPSTVRTVHLPENVGVGGRNAGVSQGDSDLLFFLDDDAWLPEPDTLARIAAIFAADAEIGMVQTRLADPATPEAPRYWVPRLRKGDPGRSSTAMYVLEAAVAIRRDVFELIGGWAANFRYAHEGIEMAWRVWDTGHSVWYVGDIVTNHPAILPTRHAEYQRLNARNRVWLARRNLPWVFAAPYLGVWSAVEWRRTRSEPEAWRVWRLGWADGWRSDPGQRRPISFKTAWQMARHGRPPIV